VRATGLLARSPPIRIEKKVTAVQTGGLTSPGLLAAPIDLNGPGHYLHWGVIQISLANLIVIGLMLLLFVAAILLPFPRKRGRR
jgi:hypothetical protein